MKLSKYLLIILFASTILVVSGCNKEESETEQETASVIPVTVQMLQKKEIKTNIKVSGQFTTDDETYLSFKTGGVVKSVYVKEGEAVKKNQLLAVLDLREIQAMVKQAEIGFQKAERDYKRAQQLYKDSVATLEQFENAKTGLQYAEEQLTIAHHNLQYSEIRAVSDGYILKRFVNDGQIVGPGTPVLQTNGAGRGNWLLRVSLSDKEWAAIKPGDKASISSDILGNTEIAGMVLRKSETVDPFIGTFSADIKIQTVGNINPATGLFGKAVITPAKTIEAWEIPFDAVLDGDAGKGYVFTTANGTTAHKTPITISRITTEYVIVTGGLENAGMLILTGNAYLKQDSKIKVLSEKDGGK